MDHETDLRRELENAQAECARLREENTRLREQLLTLEKTQSFNYSTETPFQARRYCYRVRIDDWIDIGERDSITVLAKRYILHLDQESYFELF